MLRSRVVLLAVAAVLLAAPAHAQPRRVAVLDFANTAKDPAVDWLGPAAASAITTKLDAIRAVEPVERAQLYRLLQEQKLDVSDLVAVSQAVALGKLLGAHQVVLGEFSGSDGLVRFTARFVDTATGTIVGTHQVDGSLDRANPKALFATFEQLAQAAIESLSTTVQIVEGVPRPGAVVPVPRIHPTPGEQARLARAPTTSLEAQKAYGRGAVALKRHQWAEAAREFEGAASLDPDYAAAWLDLAFALENQGRWPQSLTASRKAYELYAREADGRGQMKSLTSMGGVQRSQGRYAEALSAHEQALRLGETLGDEGGQAKALNNIGLVYYSQGRDTDALSFYERSLRLRERLGDAPGQVSTLNNVGLVHHEQGRYTDALSFYERSLRLAEQLGDEPTRSRTLNNIGLVHYSQGRYAEALRFYDRSLRIAEKLGDEPAESRTLSNIGLLHYARGRYEDALGFYEQSLRLRAKLGDEPAQMRALGNVGLVLRRLGRAPEALDFYERSLRLAEKLGDEPTQAQTLNNIGIIKLDEKRTGEALDFYERSLRLAEKLGDEPTRARALNNIGLVHRDQGQYAEALGYLDRAIEIADRLGMAEREMFRQTREQIRGQAR